MTAIKQFNTALYLRLSKEDNDGLKISESIINQKEILMRYCSENNYRVNDIYSDDGYSGTNFDRPDFKRLICDIENGKINMVITKDLSRFGRDYIITGHYIEKYFPEHNVRFIAVNDDIDTFSNSSLNDITPFKSVLNDLYARDISKKVRSALDSKKKNGKFIGSFAPYGYKKDAADKNHLIIDEEVSLNIKTIFNLFLAGESMNSIARILTMQGIPTPVQYRTYCDNYSNSGWNSSTIKNILINPVYTGTLIQNKTKKINYKSKKKITLQKDQWIITENTHEPIICDNEFMQVQSILQKRSYQTINNHKNIFTGTSFCGACGKPMTISKQGKNRYYLVCSGWKKNSKTCTSHCINYNKVLYAVINELKIQIKKINVSDMSKETALNSQIAISNEISKIESSIKSNEQTRLKLYKDKINNLINENSFTSMFALIDKEQEKLRQKASILKKLETNNDKCDIEDIISDNFNAGSISKNEVAALINKIIINSSSEITVEFAFNRID